MNRPGTWAGAAILCCAPVLLAFASTAVARRPAVRAARAARPAFVRQSPTKSDEYGDVTIGDEKARLDNMAIELQNVPGAVGYIVVYAGRRSRAGLARARANRARNFLIENRGFEPARLFAVDGGYREELTTELFIVPRGSRAPTPTPTVSASEAKRARDAARRKRRRGARR